MTNEIIELMNKHQSLRIKNELETKQIPRQIKEAKVKLIEEKCHEMNHLHDEFNM